MKISIRFKSFTIDAVVRDTETGRAIFNSLPIDAHITTWGRELYFEIPQSIALEADAALQLAVGNLAYWPIGRCFCIFWGPTSMSTGSQPVAVSAVNVFGDLIGDFSRLKSVQNGEKVRVTAK